MKARFLVPLGLFLVLAAFLLIGLYKDPREVPSPLIGKPAPAFEMVHLRDASQTFSRDQMKGKVWLLNVWGSWCPACRDEHAQLMEMSRQNVLPIIGMNYKDKNADALAWLAQYGDPYTLSVIDPKGAVGLDFGVYGAPETFLIDKNMQIRYKHIGPLTPQVWEGKLLPLIKELQNAP